MDEKETNRKLVDGINSLNRMKKKELIQYARAKNIKVGTKLTKAEIIKRIEGVDKNTETKPVVKTKPADIKSETKVDPKLETKPAAKTKPAKVKTEAKAKPKADPKPKTKPAAKSKTEAKAKPKADPKPETKPAAKIKPADIKSETKTDPKPETKADPKPETKPAAKIKPADIKPETKTDPKSETKPAAKTKPADIKSETKTDPKPETKTAAKTKPAKVKTEAKAKPKADPKPETKPAAKTKPADIKSETKTEPKPETKTAATIKGKLELPEKFARKTRGIFGLWFISAIATIAYICTGLIPFAFSAAEDRGQFITDATMNSNLGYMLIAIITPIVVSFILFSDLHKRAGPENKMHKKMVIRWRENNSKEYLHKIIIGIVTLAIPVLINFAFLLIASKATHSGWPIEWIGNTCVIILYGFIIGIAAGTITGKPQSQVLVTLIFLFAPYGIASILEQFFLINLGGYISTIAAIEFSVYTSLFNNPATSELTGGYMLAITAIGLLGYILYRIKPLDKNGVGITYGIIGKFLIWAPAFFVGSATGLWFMHQSQTIGPKAFTIFILGGAVTFILANMIVSGTFKVFTKSDLASLVIFAGLFVLFLSAITFDVIGYNKEIPRATQLKKAVVTMTEIGYDSMRYEKMIFEDTQKLYPDSNNHIDGEAIDMYASPVFVAKEEDNKRAMLDIYRTLSYKEAPRLKAKEPNLFLTYDYTKGLELKRAYDFNEHALREVGKGGDDSNEKDYGSNLSFAEASNIETSLGTLYGSDEFKEQYSLSNLSVKITGIKIRYKKSWGDDKTPYEYLTVEERQTTTFLKAMDLDFKERSYGQEKILQDMEEFMVGRQEEMNMDLPQLLVEISIEIPDSILKKLGISKEKSEHIILVPIGHFDNHARDWLEYNKRIRTNKMTYIDLYH